MPISCQTCFFALSAQSGIVNGGRSYNVILTCSNPVFYRVGLPPIPGSKKWLYDLTAFAVPFPFCIFRALLFCIHVFFFRRCRHQEPDAAGQHPGGNPVVAESFPIHAHGHRLVILHLQGAAPGIGHQFPQLLIRNMEALLVFADDPQHRQAGDFWHDTDVHQAVIQEGQGRSLIIAAIKFPVGRHHQNSLGLHHTVLIQNKTRPLAQPAEKGVKNPNSVAQMKEWLAEHGMEIESLGKKEVAVMLKDAPPDLAEALLLRQQLAKSSVKKYQAMQNCVCKDGRAHGMFMFYGANRTGRFAGRLVQLQNLPQNHMSDLEEARSLVRCGAYDSMQLLYDSVPDVLSELIRTAFIPYQGGKFIVADFSAIEARVIAWLAGEQWRLDVFRNGGDIYCASTSQMFHVPVEKHGVNGHLRQKGKIAELALGYGGSVGALKAMGALEMGIPEEELKPLVDAWRSANPHITQLWWDIDKAVKTTVAKKIPTEAHGIRFVYESGFMFICLPSGRRLAYVKPRIGENRFGGESVTYEGVGGTKKWERLESYGPKFVENIVQALSRDILCYAMKTLHCCNIVAHVHDEIIIEADPKVSLDAVCEQMGRTPPWAEGLILRVDGYDTQFYKKD